MPPKEELAPTYHEVSESQRRLRAMQDEVKESLPRLCGELDELWRSGTWPVPCRALAVASRLQGPFIYGEALNLVTREIERQAVRAVVALHKAAAL